jgi:hypothetical protein
VLVPYPGKAYDLTKSIKDMYARKFKTNMIPKYSVSMSAGSVQQKALLQSVNRGKHKGQWILVRWD